MRPEEGSRVGDANLANRLQAVPAIQNARSPGFGKTHGIGTGPGSMHVTLLSKFGVFTCSMSLEDVFEIVQMQTNAIHRHRHCAFPPSAAANDVPILQKRKVATDMPIRVVFMVVERRLPSCTLAVQLHYTVAPSKTLYASVAACPSLAGLASRLSCSTLFSFCWSSFTSTVGGESLASAASPC